jgi:heptosyltransferase-3
MPRIILLYTLGISMFILCMPHPAMPHILVIAPTRIGDAVLATSILEHIRVQQPNARVSIITSSLSAPLYAGYPLLGEVIAIDKQRRSMHWWHIWRAAIGTHWDAVWDMRGSALAYMVRTRHRYVFNGCDDPLPKVKQYEQRFGITLPYPVLWEREADGAYAASLLGDAQNILALAPCANWGPKEWPMERFAELAKRLCHERAMRPMVICAAPEQPRAQALLNALAEFSPIDLTRGEATLLGVYACLKRAHLFVGNDSGLMHMAAAASIPTFGLFGPTPHAIYQPYGAAAHVVVAPGGKLDALSVDAVAESIRKHCVA